MEMKDNSWQKEEFTVQVDEVIKEFARCEFPDEEMRDIPISVFPFEPKDRERYQMKYDENGNLTFVSRTFITPNHVHRRVRPKWVRFSRRR